MLYMNISEVPPEEEWLNVKTGDRRHPYGMYKYVNRKDIEVVSSISDEDNRPKRWVYVHKGKYCVWFKASAEDEYGYDLQPEERVSDAEFDAIQLKCDAIEADQFQNADPAVYFDEAYEALEEAVNEKAELAVIEHLIIATYYAAKMDPEMDEDFVDDLREIVHEKTNHVDTSHPETLNNALSDTLG